MDPERLTEVRPWLLGAAGIAVVLARHAVEAENGWPALGLYAIGALMFGVAVVRIRRVEPRGAGVGAPWTTDTKRLLVAVAALLVLLYVTLDVFDVSGTVWLLQLAAGATLLGAAHLADRGRVGADPPPTMPVEASLRTALIGLTAITAVGAWLRFRNLGDVPRGLWFDEADLALFARRMVDDGERPLFAGPVPAYYSYLIAVFTTLFGESVATVRAVSAVAGTLTIPAAYFAARELFGRSAGLVAAAVIATSRWALTLSRIGMNNVLVPLCALVALGFALRGHRRGSHLDFAIAGMAAASGMLFYPAMSATIVAIALLVVGITFGSGRRWRTLGTKVVFVVLGGLVVFTPLAKVALTEPDIYFSRTRQTALWSEGGLSDQNSAVGAFVDNVGEYFRMTHWGGDPNGRHNIPREAMLSPLVAALSTLGVGVAIMRRDRWLALLVLAWFPLGHLPGLLSLPFEAPNSLRAVTILALASLAATAAVFALARTFAENRRFQIGLVVAVAAGLALTGFHEARDYFGANENRSDVWALHSTYETVTAEFVAGAEPDQHIAAVAFLRNSKQQEFLSPNRTFDAIFGTDQSFPMVVPPDTDAVFLTNRESADLVAQAERFYPGATVQTAFGPHPLDLIAVRVPAADLDATRGWRTTDTGVAATFVADEAGEHRFRAAEGVTLIVDGTSFEACGADASIALSTGRHRIEIAGATAEDPTVNPAIEWVPPSGGDWRPIPPDRIYDPAMSAGGLLAEHFDGESPADGDVSGPALVEIEATTAVRMHELVRPRPYTTVWSGEVEIEATGEHRLRLTTDDETRVELGGSGLLTVGAEGGTVEVALILDEGQVPIRIVYVDRDGRSDMRLEWVPPGAGLAEPMPIPSERLTPWSAARPGC